MSRQLTERGETCLVQRLPRPRARWLAGWGEAGVLLYAFTPAPSPTHAVARSMRRKFYYSLRLLLVPTTLVRHIIILFGIYMSFSTPSIYLYKATIKNTFCIYTRPQIVFETKVTTPSIPVYGSISKSLQPRKTVSGRINFVLCTVRSFFSRIYVYRGIN